jgi:hypothetical protein
LITRTLGGGRVGCRDDLAGSYWLWSLGQRTIVHISTHVSASRRDELDGHKQAIEQDIYGWSVNNGNGCTMMDSVVSVAGVSEGGNAAFLPHPPCKRQECAYCLSCGRYLVDPGEQFEFFIACINIYLTVVMLSMDPDLTLLFFLFLFLFLSLLLYD